MEDLQRRLMDGRLRQGKFPMNHLFLQGFVMVLAEMSKRNVSFLLSYLVCTSKLC